MKPAIKILLIVICAFFCFACAVERQPLTGEGKPAPTPTARINQRKFKDDLEYIRSQQFDLIFVLRRKDGKVFDSEDSAFIKANSMLETNQRLITDEGKTLIVGSNFRYTPEQIAALKKRFDFQDMSPVKEQPANSNANAKNKNAK